MPSSSSSGQAISSMHLLLSGTRVFMHQSGNNKLRMDTKSAKRRTVKRLHTFLVSIHGTKIPVK